MLLRRFFFLPLCLVGSSLLCAQSPVMTNARTLSEHLIHRVEPINPPEAKSAKLPAVVDLKVRIGVDGSVTSAEPVNGPVQLRVAAVNCVKQWRYRPFKNGTAVVSAEGPVSVDFFPPNYETTDAHSESFYHPVQVSEKVSGGLIARKVAPVYPSIAKAARIQGVVKLKFVVTPSGDVDNIKVIGGEAMLQQAAVNAVKQWKYHPYQLNGKPTAMETTGEVPFQLP